jgi:sugar phosphate isomerase/epimerase
MPQISFITANYVARAMNYDGTTDWAAHDAATLRTIDGAGFGSICSEIADGGFDHIDIWTAHCNYEFHNDSDYLEVVKGLCSAYDFTISSYAGGLRPTTAADLDAPFRFMKQLGAQLFAGGIYGSLSAQDAMPHIQGICEKYNVRYAFENHYEKSVDEILAKAGPLSLDRCGVALDTGWCTSMGIDAVDAAKRLRDRLSIVHLKDVKAAGQPQQSCALGDGISPVEQVVSYLVKDGWDGCFSIEHAPFDRDPMPEVAKGLKRLKEWIGG